MNIVKVLPVDVYKSEALGDCTNGGVSSRYKTLLLICPDGFLNVDLDNPPDNLMKAVRRVVFGKDYWHIEPVKKVPKGHAGYMSGGNYAASSDSRFARMFCGTYGAISIHDRTESHAMYNMLSM